MDKKKVLVFPAGWENALEIADALKYNVNVEVFGASAKADYAEYAYDKNHYIEGDFYINHEGFLAGFNEMLSKYSIDVVIPSHDDVALFMAEHINDISARVLVAKADTARVCRHKSETYRLFSDTDFCPIVYTNREEAEKAIFPLFIKPDADSGAHGARILETKDDLTDEMFNNNVICEMLPGNELTVDCFTNRHGELTFSGPRRRDSVVAGMAFRSTAVELTEDIKIIAETINERLDFFGGWYFQIKKDIDGHYKLLEVSCRTSGGMTLFRHMGVNFQMMGIFELYGIDTSFVLLNTHIQMDRRLLTRFKTDIDYNSVYLDYDDTLIVNEEVCDVIIRFLYQCVNNNIRIILLTRHDGNMNVQFRKYRLAANLFDEIIHLTWESNKADFIKPERAIFIDNSFAERKEIADRLHIPVLDVDMVDMLLE